MRRKSLKLVELMKIVFTLLMVLHEDMRPFAGEADQGPRLPWVERSTFKSIVHLIDGWT